MINELYERWKRDLLNMSRNNNLLYFDCKRGLQIILPEINDLFDRINNEEVLTFRKRGDVEQPDLFGYVSQSNFDIKSDKVDAREEYKKLNTYYKNNRFYNEERGVNCLYLSFLFLQWNEPSAFNETIISPLLLVPVSLLHDSSYGPYKLHLQENEVIVNSTLKAKLQSDFNLELPDFGENGTLSSYKTRCIEAFNEASVHFEVIDKAYLAFFHFTNLSIYNDLVRNEDNILSHEILRAIGGEGNDVSMEAIVKGVEKLNLDQQIKPDTVFQVLDADESQRIAIEMAKRGVSFVLQGPPGTGKSQTITNVIAESIAAGKKVLFVSEKEAALNVVKSRLESANLLDFCLPVHSHESNKKRVVDDIYNTVHDRTVRNNIDVRKLEQLNEKRNELNAINQEIHKIIQPLSKSIFDVNSELSSFENIPYLEFYIQNVDSTTEEELNHVLNLIDRLKQSIANIEDIRYDSRWNHCKLDTFTLQQRNLFSELINNELNSRLEKIATLCNDLSGNGDKLKYNELDKFVEFLIFCATADNIPSNWNNDILGQLKSVAEELSAKQKEMESDDLIVSALFEYEIKDFDTQSLRTSVSAASDSINEDTDLLRLDFNDDNSVDYLKSIFKKVSSWLQSIQMLVSLDESSSVLSLGWRKKRLAQFEDLKNVTNAFNEEMCVTNAWMSFEGFAEIKGVINELEIKANLRAETIREIEENFDSSFLGVDVATLLPKFRSEYDVFYRFLKPSYRKDMKLLKGLCKREKLTYSDSLHFLSSLQTVKECEAWIDSKQSLFKEYNIIINSYSADYNKYYSFIETIQTIYSFFSNKMPDNVAQFIVEKQCLNNSQLSDAISLLSSIEGSDVLNISKKVDTFGDLENLLVKLEKVLRKCVDTFDCLDKYAIRNIDNGRFIEPLIRWQCYIHSLESRFFELNKLFSPLYYSGKDTDWVLIQQKIDWLEQYLNLELPFNLESDFSLKLFENKIVTEKANATADSIKSIKSQIDNAIKWFDGWFAEDRTLLNYTCEQIVDISAFYINNIDRMEDYLHYKSTAITVRKTLPDFVNRIVLQRTRLLYSEEQELDYKEYDKIYLKRFYTLWLDKVMSNSLLNQLSVENINALMCDFKTLDKGQFSIASDRIRQILKKQCPQVNTTVGPNSEMGILKKQHSLTRKHLPLRQLFSAIPNLLLSVKPCIMMSPLSVSIFLENPKYVFDLVIFDEASQIKPEYAIGSIVRGKQIIVAGDNKQLPPFTNFQKTVDRDEESILDLCNSVLDSTTLKWHYRSKHEGLITISNLYMYEKGLEVFPSKCNNVPSYGVDYNYVNDWNYSDSINKPEAKLVAKLVFEHFESHPDRSLGVITHNVKQVDVIEHAIDELRVQHPEYESFFDEKLPEKFFVKNIDNVQGDERDTIIYSICYGKTKDGSVSLQMGPINEVGGERRINVAITRAKYNLKVVTSLTADDIHISDNKEEITGPKLLKYFLDYAKRGEQAINNRLITDNNPSFDSPFEKTVYDYLRSMNYKVDTQVGCAKYKIDLGVRDPHHPNQYVLAIECDGASYHSSKYARERDRLRQEVLENMGWKFYRIWSTDWIKHIGDSKKRLIEAVDAAINKTAPVVEETVPERHDIVEMNESDNVETRAFKDLFVPSHNYKYSRYKTKDGIYEIIQNEEPISKQRLYRLLFPAFKRQKISESFCREIDELIKGHMHNPVFDPYPNILIKR